MENLVDILNGIVNAIDLTIKVDSIVDNGNGTYTLNVCETKYLTVNKTIVDANTVDFKVISFVKDVSITVKDIANGIAFTTSSLTIPRPKLIHGTPKIANDEYKNLSKRTNKRTPFIWLLENYEFEDMGFNSEFDAKFRFKLFIMDWFEVNWKNDEHKEFAIKPMTELVDIIMDIIDNSFNFEERESHTVKIRPRFGVIITNQGNSDKIIDEDLSGVEVTMELKVFDTTQCKC